MERVSFEIASGEAVGLLGESGCGKSTLAASLLRLHEAGAVETSGTLLWQGRDLLAMADDELRKVRGAEISLINQEPALALNPVLRAGTQIAEVLRAHHLPAAEERVCELLHEVGFTEPSAIARAYPHQLSGGQRQRVGIAQALACRPQLVVADEATSKLDAVLQSELLGLFATLRQKHGTAFLLITHDPAVLAAFADRVLVMYAGRMVEQCSMAQMLAGAAHPYTSGLAHMALESASAGRRFSEFPSGAPAASGCRFESRCPDRMAVCTTGEPPQTILNHGSVVSCFKFGHVD